MYNAASMPPEKHEEALKLMGRSDEIWCLKPWRGIPCFLWYVDSNFFVYSESQRGFSRVWSDQASSFLDHECLWRINLVS